MLFHRLVSHSHTLSCVCLCVVREKVRMLESLALFKQWCNHRAFVNEPLILAFTKKDEYEADFSAEQLKRVFPDFSGTTADEGYAFMQAKFVEVASKRSASAPFHKLAVNLLDADGSSALRDTIHQVVANHRAEFVSQAVTLACERFAKERKGRLSRMGTRSLNA